MALPTAASTMLKARAGQNANMQVRAVRLQFAGDGAYAAGGSLLVTAWVEAILKAAGYPADITILDIISGDCAGYKLRYLHATDALKVYQQTDTATAPDVEDTTSNQSGRTYNMTVLFV